MTIAICASLKAHSQIMTAAKKLESLGHHVLLPWTTLKIEKKELKLKEINAFKKKFKSYALTLHFQQIKKADAILVINQTKNKIPHYLGGNTLIEMGYAYFLKKPIYLLNPIPDMIYTEEIVSMKPIILRGNLTKIKA